MPGPFNILMCFLFPKLAISFFFRDHIPFNTLLKMRVGSIGDALVLGILHHLLHSMTLNKIISFLWIFSLYLETKEAGGNEGVCMIPSSIDTLLVYGKDVIIISLSGIQIASLRYSFTLQD